MASIKGRRVYDNSIINAYEQGEEQIGLICTCGRMSSSDMMMTVAIDNEKLRSTNCSEIHCGVEASGIGVGVKAKHPFWLESSFVHLSSPENETRRVRDFPDHKTDQCSSRSHHQNQRCLLERHQYLLRLLEASYLDDCSVYPDGRHVHGRTSRVELCTNCIDFVASALETDTQRLHGEIEVYEESIRSARERMNTFQKTTKNVKNSGLASNISLQDLEHTDHKVNDNVVSIERAYQDEIDMLKNQIQIQYEELLNHKRIYKEQSVIADNLTNVEETREQEQNALELRSKAFDNRRQILTKTLSRVQQEVDKLTCVSLPGILFNLQVDEARGLHYPLINQLRLAFRPKGDVPAQEIQVAWSQATQLLLVLGTLLEYPGVDWKLVPLADCAKLIYRKEIFNLVPGDCRSLMAWNALLDQIIKHTLSLGEKTNIDCRSFESAIPAPSTYQCNTNCSKPPYSSSPTMIGNTDLARLDPIDHVSWSQVIHRMASNLYWLSSRASSLAARQVSGMAHCVV